MQIIRSLIEEDGRIFQLWDRIQGLKSWHGISAKISPVFWVSDLNPLYDLLRTRIQERESRSSYYFGTRNAALTRYSDSETSEFQFIPELYDDIADLLIFNFPVIPSISDRISTNLYHSWDYWFYERYTSYHRRRFKEESETLEYDINLLPGSNKDSKEDINQIIGAGKELGLSLRLREVPMPQLYFAPGDTLNGVLRGTVGGVVLDQNSNTHFAVTCGHVSGPTGTTVIDANGNALNVTEAHLPQASPQGSVCTQGKGNKLDVGLVDIGGATYSNRASAVTSVKHPLVSVNYAGAVSSSMNSQVAYTKALSVVQRFQAGTSYYCFEDTIVFRPQLPQMLNSQISRSFVSGPKPGDSGSWLLTTGKSGAEWCGLVIGADLNWSDGYAIEADKIISWGNGKGLDLCVA